MDIDMEYVEGLSASDRRFFELMRFEHNAIIRAGAGTGKTYSLVSFILHQLAGIEGRELAPSRICAITFTEKAAAELKWRIRQRVAHLVSHPEDDAPLRHTCAALGIDMPGSNHWERVYRELGGMVVLTFHGFCAQVLRRFPVEADVEPGFRLESELVGQSLLADVVEEVVLDRLGRGDRACLRLLDVLPLSNSEWRSGLSRLVASTLRQIREDGLTVAEVQRLHEEAEERSDARIETALLDALHAQKQTLEALWAEIDRAKMAAGSENDRKLVTELETFVTAASDLEERIRSLNPEPLAEHVDLLASYAKPLSRSAARAGGLHWSQKAKLAGLPTLQDDFMGRLLVGMANRLRDDFLGLLRSVESAFVRRKRTSGVLDFADLLLVARTMLREHRHVRRALKQRFEVVLVDEFQDTNRVQLDLVMLMAETLEAEAAFSAQDNLLEQVKPGERRVFLVGDPKQSIYNFRGADVSVFRQVERRLVDELGVAKLHFLQVNRRSTADLVAFGNRWFQQVLGSRDEEDRDFVVRFGEGDRMEAWRDERPDGPSVEIVAVPPRSKAEDEAVAAARWILEYMRGAVAPKLAWREERRYSDVAILMRRFTHLERFQRALEQARIPYYVVKGKGFYKSSEVSDLIHALKVMLRPDDALALVSCLRSPMFLLSDDGLVTVQSEVRADSPQALTANLVCEVAMAPPRGMLPSDVRALESFARVYAQLGPNGGRLGPRKTMEVLIEQTHFREKLAGSARGLQRVGNVEKLMEIASTYERVGSGGMPGFVRTLEWLIEEEPREAEEQVVEEHANAVRIMTIHQAKGLEFPVVMVPEVHVMKASNWYREPFRYDRDCGLAVGLNHQTPRGLELVRTAGHEELVETSLLRREAEERRLLYVAATRARDVLWLSGWGRAWTAEGWRTPVSRPTHLSQLQDMLVQNSGELGKFVVERSIIDLSAIQTPKEAPPIAVEIEDALDLEAWRGRASRVLDPERAMARSIRPVVELEELACYDRCPRRYFLRRVLGLDVADRGPGGLLPGADASRRRGEAARAALSMLDLDAWPDLNATQRRQHLAALLTATGSLDEVALRETLEVLSDYLETHPLGHQMVEAHREGRLQRQHPFMLRVERPTGGEVIIRGELDAVIHRDDGSLLVLEDLLGPRPERGLAPFRFRLRCLALAALSLSPEPSGRWATSMVFLREPSRGLEVLQGTEADLEMFRHALPEQIHRLLASQRAQRWPQDDATGTARTAHRCRAEGCGYLDQCFPGSS